MKRGDVVQIDTCYIRFGGRLGCISECREGGLVLVSFCGGEYGEFREDRVACIGPAVWIGDLLDEDEPEDPEDPEPCCAVCGHPLPDEVDAIRPPCEQHQ